MKLFNRFKGYPLYRQAMIISALVLTILLVVSCGWAAIFGVMGVLVIIGLITEFALWMEDGNKPW